MASQLRPVLAARRTRRRRSASALGAGLALVLSVAACDADDTSDDVDEVVDDVEERADEISGDVAEAIEEVGEDAVELAVRNLARMQAQDEFADAGHPIDGELSCTADASEALDAVEIGCVGETEAGQSASMTGTTTELPGESLTELEGEFVGLVDDQEVFRTDALG